MDARGARSRHANRFLKNRTHPALIDIAHGEGMNPGVLHNVALLAIHRADSNQSDIGGIHLRRVTEDPGQLLGTLADAARQRHSMDVAARAALGRIHIGMRVDPDQAQPFAPAMKVPRSAGDRSHRDGMIAAEYQRKCAGAQSAIHHLGHQGTGFRDLRQILGARMHFGLAFALDHGHVAQVFHFIAQRQEPAVEIRHPHRRWSHVDSAPSRA